jgi:pre-mRNA-splicing factor SYF1
VEESINGEKKPELVRGLFDAMFELKVVTPQSVLNYAQFETEKLCFEKAVQILEKGIALFPWPHCRDLWLMYLQLANQRRFSTERMRDLYEQVLSKCEVKFLPVFFYSFYLFELDRGMASDAIAVSNRASSAVQLTDKATFYVLAAKQAMDIQGLAGARRVLQGAVDSLTEVSKKSGHADRLVMDICVEYSRIETEAGQIERARKLLEHAAQFANPAKEELAFIWEMWKNFEVQHGTEETYKELKRVRRYVDVMYSDKHFNVMEAGMEPTVTETATCLEAPAQPAPGIDISKLRQVAQLRKQDDADFVPSESFQGSKPGFVFKNGEQGPGYYRDK